MENDLSQLKILLENKSKEINAKMGLLTDEQKKDIELKLADKGHNLDDILDKIKTRCQ